MFEAEVVDMEIFMETLGEIKYNPMMLGVPISGPSYIYGYSMSVIHNTQRPESTLKKKKSNYICYHAVWSMCQICYTTFMMICDHLRENIRLIDIWYKCRMRHVINVHKA